MTNSKVKNTDVEVKYYGGEDDPMWQMEIEALTPWLHGRGIDVGCGTRSFDKAILRVDIDKEVKPDVVASGDKLPIKDNDYDFIIGIHSFEHFEDPKKTLTEWLRVIKKGGIVGIVHPDIEYTKKQNPEIDNEGLKANPFNRHYHEHTADTFIKMIAGWKDLSFKIIDYGIACAEWSFYVILKKI